ncbi:MAG: hypothetical protein J2P36_34915, partial [Ktedonobacteraceae bacterium]|nr:hypothetical protein [Ktedonobacteraceae bacterium]
MLTFLMFFLLVIILLALIGVVGLCWYISNRLLQRKSGSSSFNILVMKIDGEAITLQRTKNTQRPGIFGITGADGEAMLGPILTSDANTVTRQLLQVAGTLAPQTKVAWNTTVFRGTLRDQLKLTIDEITIPGPLGEMPTWFVPGKLDVWAILVHGSTGTREQGLRVFQTLATLGVHILDITYRNDDGAPPSTDGLSHLGETEWEDLEASVTYALAHGAQR